MTSRQQPINGGAPAAQLAEKTIGMDLGDRWSRYCVLDRGGEIVQEDRLRTTADGLEQRFGKIPPTRIVVEAGTHSPWISRQLELTCPPNPSTSLPEFNTTSVCRFAFI